VFIAMVLVAAIAAGVLINTAGFLQTQAENTGTESTEQVSNNINVLGAVGQVNNSDQVNQTRLTVAPAAGSAAVNLEELTIQYVADDEFANLVHNSTAQDGDYGFETDAITAEDRSDNVMTDSTDRYEIIVPLGSNVTGAADNSDLTLLDEGEAAELTITTAAGAQLTATVQVPESLAGSENGSTVSL
jgi:flagellin FlaB